MLKQSAFTPLLYGGKGILWYCYDTPNHSPYVLPSYRAGSVNYNSPTENGYGGINHPVYDTIQSINLIMKNFGGTLLKLDWENTVHGGSMDSSSEEIGLPTIASLGASQNLLTSSSSMPNRFAVGMLHVRHAPFNKYLILLNKDVRDIATAESSTLVAAGKYYVQKHIKSNNLWAPVTSTYNATNRTTSFTVSVEPGDMELVWLANGSELIPSNPLFQ